MSSVLISLVAVFFLLMGVYALATPAGLAEPFGIVVQTPVARSEIRAVYGGFGIAIAVLLGAAAVDIGDIRRGAVIAVAAALGGMALGRIVSRALDRPVGFYPSWFYCGVELAAAALLCVAV
ncbi:DUF4345 domain-containing protein [Nocardia sp. NBC_01503]|uniref:DUF4345 domain-containing protein n=1 Tax=Nocardia sp. NBC_01503 TaxID=2975997 RepID=UPI002E7AE5BF|nr:DUF4345 domain-containing protein [Nocardia sp. NBC_01503]WTL36273.1 DUF4345 domain-containing protein [Nocardia sp. NBC_01503]